MRATPPATGATWTPTTRANAEALDAGGRLFSSYETPVGVLWVITEADRSATTVLRPEDY